jgi:hypothetical protein
VLPWPDAAVAANRDELWGMQQLPMPQTWFLSWHCRLLLLLLLL